MAGSKRNSRRNEPDSKRLDPHAHETTDTPSRDKQDELREALDRATPSGRIVYQAVIEEADEELERTSPALFFSGLAAGMSMGFSLIAEAILRGFLPVDARWADGVAKLGYTVGFVIVILSRQQLFTENTLTPVLPLMRRRDRATLMNVARLWAVVLAANLIGAAVISLIAMKSSVFNDDIQRAMIDVADKATAGPFVTIMWRGVFAGWLIASLVWMMPAADQSRFWVILFVTYVVGIGGFSHVVAGSVEAFALAWEGRRGWGDVTMNFLLPAFLGNVIGGVTLVAGLNHAQMHAGSGDESDA